VTTHPSFAVIFDMDGVLVDSEPLTIRAYLQAAAEHGLPMDEGEFIQHFVIEGTLIRSFFEAQAKGTADWEDFFQRKTEIYRELVRDELKLMPGAVALLTELRAHNIPLALATSAARVTIQLVLTRFNLASYFENIVSLEDVTRPKPDPEPFLKAAALLDTPPHRCVVIEDAAKGVVAARAAGMKCVVVPTALTRPNGLVGADLVLRSLEELTTRRLAALVGLPGGNDERRPCRRGGCLTQA
jgi:HAD superfamily hydrolase (TIGR01509 family)